MDLIDKVHTIAKRAEMQISSIQTEEATKTALIMPFLTALGYDVFDPTEVIPEYTADVGTKKGEKVDYAIAKEGKVSILIEAKYCGADLQKGHASQLYRYYAVTEARFGLLTNGLVYQFYSDLDQQNKMDSTPFFVFDIRDFEDHQIIELKRFSKSAFSVDDILTTAKKLKYTRAIKKVLEDELENPSEEFVRFFLTNVYDGMKTQQVIVEFTGIVQEARRQFINEKINARLQSALSGDSYTSQDIEYSTPTDSEAVPEPVPSGIVTTEEEAEGFLIVRAIAREVVDGARVAHRDTKSYFGILLDDSNRKIICRLHFNHAQKYIGFMQPDKSEERLSIESLDDIYNHAARIKSRIVELIGQK
ncbi:MAG: type I restriction enzyme HsdR N-terminal domain-containing protein [Mariprofundales bacterium]